MGGELGGDEFGGDLGGEEATEEPEAAKQIPDAFADGEKLCPCPDEETEIEINFNDLAKQLQDPEESDEEDAIDRDEEFDLGGGEDPAGEDEEDPEGDVTALIVMFEHTLLQKMAEEVTFDAVPESTG